MVAAADPELATPPCRPLSERFAHALELACRLHRHQFRKGSGVPYVAHLLAVASLALESGATEDEAIAAVLHDAVEDQGGMATAEQIRAAFGETVCDIVLACSDAAVTPKPPWRQRKEEHLAKLRTASASAHLVSLCDKLHNARSLLADYRAIGEPLWERFRGGRDGTLWYYHEFLKVSRERGHHPLVDELARAVTEIERLAGG